MGIRLLFELQSGQVISFLPLKMGNNVDTSRGRERMANISDVDKDGYITTKEATMALMGDGHLTDDEVAFIAAVKAMSIMGGKVKKEKLLAYLDAIDRIELFSKGKQSLTSQEGQKKNCDYFDL